MPHDDGDRWDPSPWRQKRYPPHHHNRLCWRQEEASYVYLVAYFYAYCVCFGALLFVLLRRRRYRTSSDDMTMLIASRSTSASSSRPTERTNDTNVFVEIPWIGLIMELLDGNLPVRRHTSIIGRIVVTQGWHLPLLSNRSFIPETTHGSLLVSTVASGGRKTSTRRMTLKMMNIIMTTMMTTMIPFDGRTYLGRMFWMDNRSRALRCLSCTFQRSIRRWYTLVVVGVHRPNKVGIITSSIREIGMESWSVLTTVIRGRWYKDSQKIIMWPTSLRWRLRVAV